MNLHEAMLKLLSKNGRAMSSSEIAEKLNRNKWYRKEDGSPIDPRQIRARAKNYPELFDKKDGLIYKREGSHKTIHKSTDDVQFKNAEKSSHQEISSPKNVPLEQNYQVFDPANSSHDSIPSKPGYYFICLKSGCTLPDVGTSFITSKVNDKELIYIGMAAYDLGKRLIKQHFYGNNAGKSTLRKSLGSLIGYSKVPRDKDPNSGKTKFSELDENLLTKWMETNLLVYYAVHLNPESIETELIKELNPPLNLIKNSNRTNSEFRKVLSELRN